MNVTDNDRGLTILILFLLCTFLALVITGCGEEAGKTSIGSFSFSDYCEPVPPDEEEYPNAQIAYTPEGGIIGWHLFGNTYKELCSDLIFTIEEM